MLTIISNINGSFGKVISNADGKPHFDEKNLLAADPTNQIDSILSQMKEKKEFSFSGAEIALTAIFNYSRYINWCLWKDPITSDVECISQLDSYVSTANKMLKYCDSAKQEQLFEMLLFLEINKDFYVAKAEKGETGSSVEILWNGAI